MKRIDAEAKASLQSASILHQMNQYYSRGDRPAHTTVAKSQATGTWDPQAEPSPSFKQAQASHSSPYLHSLSSRSQNANTSDKKSRRKRKEQYRSQEQARRVFTLDTDATTKNANSARSIEVSWAVAFEIRLTHQIAIQKVY